MGSWENSYHISKFLPMSERISSIDKEFMPYYEPNKWYYFKLTLRFIDGPNRKIVARDEKEWKIKAIQVAPVKVGSKSVRPVVEVFGSTNEYYIIRVMAPTENTFFPIRAIYEIYDYNSDAYIERTLNIGFNTQSSTYIEPVRTIVPAIL